MIRVARLLFLLIFIGLFSLHPAAAHHSWKCPPITAVDVMDGGEKSRFLLKVVVMNTCGCRIKFKLCPSDKKKKKCVGGAKWLGPRELREYLVRTDSPDGKAKFDWGTHSNEAPCLK